MCNAFNLMMSYKLLLPYPVRCIFEFANRHRYRYESRPYIDGMITSIKLPAGTLFRLRLFSDRRLNSVTRIQPSHRKYIFSLSTQLQGHKVQRYITVLIRFRYERAKTMPIATEPYQCSHLMVLLTPLGS